MTGIICDPLIVFPWLQGESEDMAFGENFVYSTLKDELVIGEVYVRVYNEQPTFVLEVRRLFLGIGF